VAAEIPFLSLVSAYRELQADLDGAMRRVFSSGRYILGQEVEAFEHEFADFVGVRHCVSVGSGLDALHLLLRAFGVGKGDEVLVPSHTFIATWLAVTHAGATPVPVEPDPATYNMDPEALLRSITPRCRAVIPVHLYGRPAEMQLLSSIAREHRLILIEDCAQAHGATHLGKRVGGLGNAGAWSFYPTKNLGALGDGGAITTNDDHIAAQVRLLRNYGSNEKYFHELLGFNSRLDDFQAALLRVKLTHLDEWNTRRQCIAKVYNDVLGGSDHIIPPPLDPGQSVWHLYVVRARHRDRLRKQLKDEGIGTLIHYPCPPHLQAAYGHLGYGVGTLQIAERLSREVLSLPMGPHLPEAEAYRVARTVRSYVDM
jgi:dTDP-4-amino-4,6-dideoxygalactose transaminase